MFKNWFDGFLMALADSVPGVSGGTIAFILGFYDHFIGSIHDLVFGKKEEKRNALFYLAKLGLGWIMGMVLAILLLSMLFETHIYAISSLFEGFILASIPFILSQEKENITSKKSMLFFCIAGIFLVVFISLNSHSGSSSTMNLSVFSLPLAMRLFFIGMIAISAMFLPGISGSTLLLIFGAYIPILSAIKEVFHMQFSYIPCLFFFGLGVIAGAFSVVKGIKICLEKYRSATIGLILGMMIGSIYAIIQGPTTLDIPQAPLNFTNFSILPFLTGILFIVLIESQKGRSQKHGN